MEFYAGKNTCKSCISEQNKLARREAAAAAGREFPVPATPKQAKAKRAQAKTDARLAYNRCRSRFPGTALLTEAQILQVLPSATLALRHQQILVNGRKSAKKQYEEHKEQNSETFQRKVARTRKRDEARTEEQRNVRQKREQGEELTEREEAVAAQVDRKAEAGRAWASQIIESKPSVDTPWVVKKAAKLAETQVQFYAEVDPEELPKDLLTVAQFQQRIVDKWYPGITQGQMAEILRRLDIADQARRKKRDYDRARDPRAKALKRLAVLQQPAKRKEVRARAIQKRDATETPEERSVRLQSAREYQQAHREAHPTRRKQRYDEAPRTIRLYDQINMRLKKHDPLYRKPGIWKSLNASPLIFLEEFIEEACVYCGSSEDLGVDRIDSKLTYLLDNVAPCCNLCNIAKSCLTTDEFLLRAARIAAYKHDPVNDGLKCTYCGTDDPTSKDRILPGSGGGTYATENVNLVCVDCNFMRKDVDLSVFLAWAQRVVEFQKETPFQLSHVQAQVLEIKARAETRQAIERPGNWSPQSIPFKIPQTGRPEGDLEVFLLSSNAVYHSPRNDLEVGNCLSHYARKGKMIPQGQDAMVLLRQGKRPCMNCRSSITDAEFTFLSAEFDHEPGPVAHDRSTWKAPKFSIVNDLGSEVWRCAADPFYHAATSCGLCINGLEYAATQVPVAGTFPCTRCRKKILETEIQPTAEELHAAKKQRARVVRNVFARNNPKPRAPRDQSHRKDTRVGRVRKKQVGRKDTRVGRVFKRTDAIREKDKLRKRAAKLAAQQPKS